MDSKLWLKVAGLSGVAALGLGTYGAHMFKPDNPAYKEVWQTASLYHLVHTSALLAAPLTKRPHIFGGLLTAGIIAFSGTCYMEPGHHYCSEGFMKYLAKNQALEGMGI
ncbi:hypothetical protein GOP47_0010466 [Adiantum capillus-veneris]|uniref:Transmembrane protein 256 homolog n=1 Tax=Adiantum capillus-veneris TaxID=13818 RepID=A0A9D4UUR8_ADICA|nr:hypothetical protein GOP47_0010466 [Adiantum capillus-veneris]